MEMELIRRVEQENGVLLDPKHTTVFKNEGHMLDYFINCRIPEFIRDKGRVYKYGHYRIYNDGVYENKN